ncbi:ABC transporter permease [Mesorhizobium hawassense]|uniref:ABC transporter permease n=1 Tax=Mesorhizobium hawassense TaxID=1209954 RepID=A0A330HVU7_9HYPH|nr:ABC transporter permease [Mesorhizobium hawassense]RAZ91762.1 ABC transporter permease [Mesorhizobium hawassense]
MFRYMLWQIASLIAVLVGAVAVLVMLTDLIPGDAASVLLGSRATPDAVSALRHSMGLDLPAYQRVARFLWNAAQGNLGTDAISGHPVTGTVLRAVPNTLMLAFGAIVVSIGLGLPLGVHAAEKPGGVVDRCTAFIAVGLISTPSFVIAILLLLVFSVRLGWTPVLGGGEGEGFLSRLHHLILPVVAVSFGWIGYIARQVRASLLDVLGQAYIRTARAYGLSNRTVLYKYALKVAIIPVVSILGVGIGDLIGKSVFVETIFGRPGLGALINSALRDRNYPVVQAGVFVVVVLFVVTNAVVDLIYAWLDPRIRERFFRHGDQ